jgi:hypothetical protein
MTVIKGAGKTSVMVNGVQLPGRQQRPGPRVVVIRLAHAPNGQTMTANLTLPQARAVAISLLQEAERMEPSDE